MEKPKTLEEAIDALVKVEERLTNIEKFIAISTQLHRYTNSEFKSHIDKIKPDLDIAAGK